MCVLQKLLPCRDLYSHRKARSTHSAKLHEIRAAAFPEIAAAGPGGKNAPQQRPMQRQQSLPQISQQLQQRQLHVKIAAPSSRQALNAVAAADSPREQGSTLIKGAGAKGDDASLPNSPTAAADTPTAAQACRGKPKVTEIFGKSSVLAPTLAQLEQKSSRLSLQGLGGMPDWDAPAARAVGKWQKGRVEPRAVTAAQRNAPAAAEQKAAPQPLKTEQVPQQWLPTDPQLRFSQTNRASEAAPESNMPKAEHAKMKQEPRHPEPSPDGIILRSNCACTTPTLAGLTGAYRALVHLLMRETALVSKISSFRSVFQADVSCTWLLQAMCTCLMTLLNPCQAASQR